MVAADSSTESGPGAKGADARIHAVLRLADRGNWRHATCNTGTRTENDLNLGRRRRSASVFLPDFEHEQPFAEHEHGPRRTVPIQAEGQRTCTCRIRRSRTNSSTCSPRSHSLFAFRVASRVLLVLRLSQIDGFVLVLSEAVLVLDQQWR